MDSAACCAMQSPWTKSRAGPPLAERTSATGSSPRSGFGCVGFGTRAGPERSAAGSPSTPGLGLERPLSLGSTKARAAANAASIPKSEVSSKSASGACLSGETVAGAVGGVAGDDFGRDRASSRRDAHGFELQPAAVGAHVRARHRRTTWRRPGARSPCRCRGRPSPRRGRRPADGRETCAGNRATRRAPQGSPPPWRRRCRPCRCGCAGSPARARSIALRGPDAHRLRSPGRRRPRARQARPAGRARPNPDARKPKWRASFLASVPLPRRRGAVDGDDDGSSVSAANSAPSPLIRPSNSGNEVAIIAVSSTVTGFFAASPITRNAIAMR